MSDIANGKKLTLVDRGEAATQTVRRPWEAPRVIESTVGHHTSKSSNTIHIERKTSSAFTSLS